MTALSVLKSLFRAATQQEQVVDDHEERVEIFEQADAFLDMERLTDTTMEQETEQLDAAHSILDELHTRLSIAINLWNASTDTEMTQEQLLAVLSDELSSDEVSEPKREEGESPPNIRDPAVGTFSKYTHQWHAWKKSPTIDQVQLTTPTPWWMKNKTHYALCQPQEQGQLESSAQAARGNRAYPPSRLPVPVHRHQATTFAQQVSHARKQYHPSAVPLPLSFNHNLSHSRPARRCSEDFWDDDDFDPDFWQKNLRPGNIWVDVPRYPVPDEDNLSPRTVPYEVGVDSKQAAPGGQAVKAAYAVGSTDPAAYFATSRAARRC